MDRPASLDNIEKKVKDFYRSIKTILSEDRSEWKSHPENWNTVLESGRKFFGEQWTFEVAATTVLDELPTEGTELGDFPLLEDGDQPLFNRMRYAQAKADSIGYWEIQLQKPTRPHFVLLPFLKWGTPKTIIKLLDKVKYLMGLITSDELKKLSNNLNLVKKQFYFTGSQENEILKSTSVDDWPDKLKFLVSFRLSKTDRDKFIYENIRDKTIKGVQQAHFDFLTRQFLDKPKESILDQVKNEYDQMTTSGEILTRRHYSDPDGYFFKNSNRTCAQDYGRT